MWVLIAVAIVLVLAVIAWAIWRRRRSEQLRERFGPEYERTVEASGRRSLAESELQEREKRREQLDIRPLHSTARTRYMESWRLVQASFVDTPGEAVGQADTLVTQVMRERGYPTEDFEQRAADISVDHPRVVENYRAAHQISMANRSGRASTEDLRQGMVHFRELFEELLETGESRAH